MNIIELSKIMASGQRVVKTIDSKNTLISQMEVSLLVHVSANKMEGGLTDVLYGNYLFNRVV